MQAAIKCQSLLAPQGALLANSGPTSMLVPKFTESWTQRSLQITFIAAITGLVQNGGLILSYNENEKNLHVKMPRSSRRCFSPWRRRKNTWGRYFQLRQQRDGRKHFFFFSCANRMGWEETYTLHPSGQNNRVASMVEYWWNIVRDFFWKSAKLVCGKILNPSKGAPGRLWKCGSMDLFSSHLSQGSPWPFAFGHFFHIFFNFFV